jgi:transposase
VLFDDPASSSPEEPEPPAIPVAAHTRKSTGRKPLPKHLERHEILIDIPDEDKQCACGHELSRIGEEISEKLEVIPVRLIVKRIVRPKYACKHCEGSGDEEKPAVRIAPMPKAVIPRGIATPTLLAFIIVNKFVDAMPLARQEKSFARLGIELPRQRMADWVMAVAEAFEPVISALVLRLRAGPVMLVDETTVQVLKEKDRADTSRSYMWVAYGGEAESPCVFYRYAAGRSTAEAAAVVWPTLTSVDTYT